MNRDIRTGHNPIKYGLLETKKVRGGLFGPPLKKHPRCGGIKTKLCTVTKGTMNYLRTKFGGHAPKGGVSVSKKPQNRRKFKSGRGRKLTRPDVSFGPHESPCKISGQSIENSPSYGLLKLLKRTGQFFY